MDLDYCFKRFEYEPHRGQIKVHRMAQESSRLCVLFGRRGGKSHCASFEASIGLLEEPHFVFGAPQVLITAPTADLTKAVFERTHDSIFKYLKSYKPRFRRSDRYIELEKLGSCLYVRSGDKPKSLVSRGYSKIVIDESGFFRDDAYRELEPALLEWPGRLIAIGVPALQNWYFDLYKDAKRGEPGYKAIQLPSVVNPSISHKEWHRLFKTLPRREFLRQYCAKFIQPITALWLGSDLDKVKSGESEPYISGCDYFAGIDIARKHDFTVVTIVKPVNNFMKVVATLKIQGVNWSNQTDLVASLLNEYNVTVAVCDATGLGDPVIEQLADKSNCGLESFIFTNDSKAQVIDGLTKEIEEATLIIPAEFVDYHQELKSFESLISRTGLRVFSAPDDKHDDHVMSLALAWRALRFNYWTG